MSNYHSFGDIKFIPEVSPEKFTTILRSNPLYQDPTDYYKAYLDHLVSLVEKEVHAIEKPYT